MSQTGTKAGDKQEGKPEEKPQTVEEAGLKSLKKFLETGAIKNRFAEILGQRAPGFIMSVLQIISSEKKLQVADLQSVYQAAARAAVMNLPLDNNLQYAHIVPYKETRSGITYAQFQLGWKGVIQLAQRTREYKTINVIDVRQGELVKENMLTGDCDFLWEQDYDKRQALPIIGYVSYFELVGGFSKMVFWRMQKLMAHAKKYSKTFDREDGRWNTDTEAMCKKTVLKENLSKYGPLSIDMQEAFKYDQSVVGEDGKPNYIDNPLTEYEDLTDEEADKIAEDIKRKQAEELANELNAKIKKDEKKT